MVFYETVFPFSTHKNGQFEVDRLIGQAREVNDICLYD